MTNGTCDETHDLLDGYIDNELAPSARAGVEAHLAQCPGCRAERDAIEAFRLRFKAAGPHRLPSGLSAKIDASFDAQSRPAVAIPSPARWRMYSALAASHLVIAVLSSGLIYSVMSRTGSQDRALHEVVNAHARASMANQLVQVASSDTHTVKPWLAARLAYSPNVADYKSDGFPLIGGRVDFLLDRPVASLVYARREHMITVFVVPLDQAALLAVPRSDWRGYHVVGWRDASFAYIATTDLNRAELEEFVVLSNRRSEH
jgi:anti-sigma factor RsiW